MKQFDFLCPGFAKCATTTLHEIMKQHQDIYLPVSKEPGYYYEQDLYKKGYLWYRTRFYPQKIMKKYLGEINPTITLKDNGKKIYRDYGPDIKLIFMLRNPIDRAYSDFKFAERNIPVDTDQRNLSHGKRFDYIIKRSLKIKDDKYVLINNPYKNIIDMGRYASRLNKYLQYYPAESFKFIIFEEFIKNPEQECRKLFEFLGIPNDERINYSIRANEGNRIKKNDFFGFVYDMLLDMRKKVLLKTPFLGETMETLIEKFYNYMYIWLTKEDKDKSKMSVDTRKKLENFYREDKEQLKKLLNKDLDQLWFR